MKKVLVGFLLINLLFTGAVLTTASPATNVTPTDLPHEV